MKSLVFLVALLLAAAPNLPAEARPAARALVARTVPLTVVTAAGPRRFAVEVARTPEEQSRGLMFRRALPRRGGMIFPMSPPRPAAFWMKNTLIPLDLIFIRADGTIARVAANAVPQSLALIESGEPVSAVLEIAGGHAAKLGIDEGDRVRWTGR